VPAQLRHAELSASSSDGRELSRDLDLERSFLVATGSVLEETLLGLKDEVVADVVGFVDDVVLLGGELRTRDDVVDAEGEADIGCNREEGKGR
jgi:hypothetical protein